MNRKRALQALILGALSLQGRRAAAIISGEDIEYRGIDASASVVDLHV